MIHRFWDGPPKPEFVDRFGQELRNMHPDVEVMDWTMATLPLAVFSLATELVTPRDRNGKWRHVSNLARYALLYVYGGVWVDCDVQPIRPFDDLFHVTVPTFASIDGRVEGALIASPKGHPLFSDLLDGQFDNLEARSVDVSGAAYMRRVVGGYMVNLLPTSAVFDHNAKGRKIPIRGRPYARHLWATSRLRFQPHSITNKEKQ